MRHDLKTMDIKPLNELKTFLKGYADPMGIEIVDVEFSEKNNALTVFIETQNGVDLDTCEAFHNVIMDPIDEFDPTYDRPYTLNVSSPGLDRPFKTPNTVTVNTAEGELKIPRNRIAKIHKAIKFD